jgi:hypothetical protein
MRDDTEPSVRDGRLRNDDSLTKYLVENARSSRDFAAFPLVIPKGASRLLGHLH